MDGKRGEFFLGEKGLENFLIFFFCSLYICNAKWLRCFTTTFALGNVFNVYLLLLS